MASATGRTAADTNGDSATATILVENPATGEQLTTVPILGSEEFDALVARAREAQPGWEGVGFEGRAKVLRRAQKWMLDNADRIIGVVVVRERQDPRGRAAGRPGLHRDGARLLGQGGRRSTSPTSESRHGTTRWRRARSS